MYFPTAPHPKEGASGTSGRRKGPLLLLKPGGLTYEPRLPFDSLVGLDFGHGNEVYINRARRLKSISSYVGCSSIEPGDTVAIDSSKTLPKTRPLQQRSYVYGTVLSTAKKAGHLIVRRDKEGIAVTEKHEIAKCHRQPDLFSVWSGPATPALEERCESLGLTSESLGCKLKMESIKAKAQWSSQALSHYKEGNLALVAKALAECAVGSTGVIYRHRLEACLVQLEAIPDTPQMRKTEMDRIHYVFGCSLKAHQLQDIVSPNIPGDSVEIVAFEDIMLYLDALINGDIGSTYFAKRCFNLYVHDGRGYIHREKLREWRRWRAQEHLAMREKGCNSFQVKVLLQLFTTLHRQEESAFLSAGKGSKKKGGDPPLPPPGSAPALPKSYTLRRHLNLAEFSDVMRKDPQLVLAFLPIALMCLQDDSALGGKMNFVPTARMRIPDKLQRTYSEFFITSSEQRSKDIL